MCLNRWCHVAMAHTQDLAGTLKALGLGFLGRVPAKTQHWACRSWNRASQGLFRAQITRLNRWCQLAMAHTQDLAGTLKPLGLGFFRRVPAKTQHWACRSWDRAAQGLFRAQITCLNRWFHVAMSHTQDLAGTLKTLGLGFFS